MSLTEKHPAIPWRTQLQDAITDPTKAFEALGWPVPDGVDFRGISKRFSVRIPRYYLDLIDPSDPKDPIALQCLPGASELLKSPGDIQDAVGDEKQSPVPGIVQKYGNRVIFLAANTCSMYCRFCFRKPVPAGISLMGLRDQHQAAFQFLRNHPDIEEVILSGGDPLMLETGQLDDLLTRLKAIPHIKIVRIHSRVPVTLPDRIDAALASALASHRPLWIVTHFNHPRELTADAKMACRRLLNQGISLLNQTVLMKDINDNASVMADLFQGLYRWGVSPYYLHHCDRTPGTAAFRTSLRQGKTLYQALKTQLSGPALPSYVLDVPGGFGKVPINNDYIQETAPGQYNIMLPSGRVITYEDEPPQVGLGHGGDSIAP